MPHTALIKYKPEAQEPEVSSTSGNTATSTSSTSRTSTVCYVSIMARRIAEQENKKKKAYKRPPEPPLGGDVLSTGNDVDSEEEV